MTDFLTIPSTLLARVSGGESNTATSPSAPSSQWMYESSIYEPGSAWWHWLASAAPLNVPDFSKSKAGGVQFAPPLPTWTSPVQVDPNGRLQVKVPLFNNGGAKVEFEGTLGAVPYLATHSKEWIQPPAWMFRASVPFSAGE